MTRPSLADITQRAAEYATRIQSFCSPRLRSIAAHESADDVPALSAAIRDVLALHTPETPRRDPDFHHTDRVCIECGDPFPCRTYTAITAHIDTTPKEDDR